MVRRFGMAWAVVLAVLGAAQSALACPLYGSNVVVADVPINGTVLIDIVCGDMKPCLQEEVPADLPVFDRNTGEEVAGAVVSVDASTPSAGVRVAWRPKQPLVVGHAYELGWSPDVREPIERVELAFKALPAATWRVDVIGISARLAYRPADKYEPVELHVDADYNGEVGEQYTVRTALWSSGEKPPPLAVEHSRSASRTFKRADSYCYRFEVQSMIDNAVKVHEACISVAQH